MHDLLVTISVSDDNWLKILCRHLSDVETKDNDGDWNVSAISGGDKLSGLWHFFFKVVGATWRKTHPMNLALASKWFELLAIISTFLKVKTPRNTLDIGKYLISAQNFHIGASLVFGWILNIHYSYLNYILSFSDCSADGCREAYPPVAVCDWHLPGPNEWLCRALRWVLFSTSLY